MNVMTSAVLRTRFPRRLASLATALAVATLVLTPRMAHAGDEVPFAASFITQFDSVVTFPLVHISVTGSGRAQHLGVTTAETSDQVHNLITGAASATYTLTGANGDTVVLALDFQGTSVDGGVTFEGTYIVVGGTGRFAGATGSGSISGSATFQGPNGGVGAFEVNGTLSSPGESK
jgi:hypothetical protein